MPFIFLLFIFLTSTVYAEPLSSDQIFYDKVKKAAELAVEQQRWAIAQTKYIEAKQLSLQYKNTEQTLDILFSLLYVYQQQSNGIAAFKTAAEIEELAAVLTDPFSLTRSYRLLGIAYQALSNNDLARDYFSVAVDSARQLDKPILLASLINELGYADVLVGDYHSALTSFQESYLLASAKSNHALMLQAQINLVRSSIALGDKVEIVNKFDLLESLLSEDRESKDYISNSLSIGTLYRTAQLKLGFADNHRKFAYSHFQRGLILAIKNKNLQQQSIALGYIGQLYSDEAQYDIAATFTQDAIEFAQKTNNIDLIYRWSVQLSRIYSASNKTQQALIQYKRSIEVLESLNIVTFMRYERDFNADVKPVFDELLSILFAKIQKEPNTNKRKKLLSEAIKYFEKLREKEFLAFCFGICKNRLKTNKNISTKQITSTDSAVLYPIALKKQLHIILKINDKLSYSSHNVTRSRLLNTITDLNQHIQNSNQSVDYRKQASILYQWLIRDFTHELEKNRVTTLAVVPSQTLMALSFDILYANGRHLIEDYSLIQVLSSQYHQVTYEYNVNVPSYHLRLSSHKNIFWISGLQKHVTLFVENDLDRLKARISEIPNNTLIEISPKLNLSNDYRQSSLVLSDRHLPLFELLSGINLYASSSVLINTSHDVGSLSTPYFNAQLLNVNSVIVPLWSYSETARVSLFSEFYQSLASGDSLKLALRNAKLSLIQHETLNHPINWAGMTLFQH